MKLNRLANKFWLGLGVIALIAVFCLSPLNAAGVTPLAETTATVYTDPTYQYNRDWYEALGVVEYNNYLADLQNSNALTTVTVAVIDSGLDYDSSPVFAGRVNTAYAQNFNTTNGRTADDWTQDESGHGTHVAGIIAAGSMANVQILPLRIFVGQDNSITFAAFANAVNYVCNLQKRLNIVAVNLSLGTAGITTEQDDFEIEWKANLASYQPYINRLRKAGILPVTAAGNVDTAEGESETKSYYAFPAACEGALAVGAYYWDSKNNQNKRASFSYYNDRISLAAPGVGIWSACSRWVAPDDSTSLLQDKYGVYYFQNNGHYYYVQPQTTDTGTTYYDLRLQGTSMATPFVTLCYALICSDPTKNSAAALGVEWDSAVDTEKPYYYLNPQHKALLLNATDFTLDDAAGKTDVYFGYGGVNVKAFAQATVPYQSSKTEDEILSPNLPSYNDYAGTGEEDAVAGWANVFWVLCGIILVIMLANSVNGYLHNRRNKHDPE